MKVFPTLILLGIGAAILNLLLPRILWRNLDPLPLRAKIVDYTVPFSNYSEHDGLVWLLNTMKVPPPDNSALWDKKKHYEGYYPHRRKWPDRVGNQPSLPWDFIYVADTYGVYFDDLKGVKDQRAHMDYSPLIFGGLNNKDAQRLKAFADRGGFLMLEFNSFCTPTPWVVRRKMEKLMGVRWTGWVGRFFADAHDNDDVPRWLPRLFRERFPERDYPEGPMLALIDWNSELVILSGRPQENLLPRVVLNERGKRRFPRAALTKMERGAPYYYWFGVFEARPKTRVHAHLILPGALEMELHHLPPHRRPELVIPLLMERPYGQSWRFYTAGDFADVDFRLPTHAEVDIFERRCDVAQRVGGISSAQVFWCFYAPVMRKLLREAAYRSSQRRSKKNQAPRGEAGPTSSPATRPSKLHPEDPQPRSAPAAQ